MLEQDVIYTSAEAFLFVVRSQGDKLNYIHTEIVVMINNVTEPYFLAHVFSSCYFVA